MHRRSLGVFLAAATLPLALGAQPATATTTPNAQELVDRLISTAGGTAAFERLGIIRLEIQEDERAPNGRTNKAAITGYVNGADLSQLRLELAGDVVMASTSSLAWATIQGALDTRKPTPHKANGLLHMKLLPALLPFSLQMPGLSPTSVESAVWQTEETWKLTLVPEKGFFDNPIFEQPWQVFLRKGDLRLLALEVDPPQEHLGVIGESIRFTVMQDAKVGDATLPSVVLMEGIDPVKRTPNGHVRTVTVKATSVPQPDFTIFVNPEILSALDEP